MKHYKRPRSEPITDEMVLLFWLLGPLAWPVRWAWRRLRAGQRALCALLALALLISGCAGTVYVSRDDMSSYERDTYECDRDSTTFGGGSGAAGAAAIIGAQREARRLYISCLKARGYTVSDRPQ